MTTERLHVWLQKKRLKIRVDAYFHEPESRKPPKTREFLFFFCISCAREGKVNEKRERDFRWR